MSHTTRNALQIIRDEHAAVAAVLRSLQQMLQRGPDEEQPERYFDVLRAMLFYIDEFPERRHHPKESDLLFPKMARAMPALMPVIERLENDHLQGERRVRELQHLLLAWELLGDSRRAAFEDATRHYVDFYLAHMRTEETEILPAAQELLSPSDWAQLNTAFSQHIDPLAGGEREPAYDRLFTRIVMRTPAPIGVGPA
ncbi:hemerythrin domain-containing protein [Ramlibacter sp. G-1-2-2]|uniref:Hemerythrin domain-containing protein n=1 Tax=Ramlibacter agri TaxID=2728837 RepID=A0A848GV42_9BURK|nr:hemerythrin domain-containing protein [Ramlibacter agri]NML42475.1 hemerythrin domain-containing protein [Ramlibacter agri]